MWRVVRQRGRMPGLCVTECLDKTFDAIFDLCV